MKNLLPHVFFYNKLTILIVRAVANFSLSPFHFSLLFDSKKIANAVKIFFQDNAKTLRVQRRFGEVAVVGLIVNLKCQIAVGEEQVSNVEIANKRRIGRFGVVAVAELSVDE